MKPNPLVLMMVTICLATGSFGQTGDLDNDGVPDAQDVCPAVAGPASNKGCPVEGGDKAPEAKAPAPDEAKPDENTAPPQQATPQQQPSTPRSGAGKTLFYETFDDNRRGWPHKPITGGPEMQSEVLGGAYQVVTGPKQEMYALRGVTIATKNAFSIAVGMEWIMNLFQEGSGLMFGADSKGNGFLLLVTAEQKYCLMKIADEKPTFLVPWTKTPWLNARGSNVLSVKQGPNQQGDGQWQIYLNGQSVKTVPADTFFGPGLGMMQAGNQANRFDELVVRGWEAGQPFAVGPREARFVTPEMKAAGGTTQK